MATLEEFYRQKVEFFLKNVVCFDDQAEFGHPADQAIRPRIARKVEDGFGEESIADSSGEEEKHLQGEGLGQGPESRLAADAVRIAPDGGEESEATKFFGLDAKALTDAFGDKGILCAVIKPKTETETNAIIKDRIVKLAHTSDVVILDWFLAGHDNTIAKESIVSILADDGKNGGRLRLIVIYSNATGSAAIEELSRELPDHRPETGGQHPGLRNNNSYVVFLSKPGAEGSTPSTVKPEDLPAKVIEIFQSLTTGLLPAATLHTIAVIREQTHHLLSTFSSKLDGAFLAHRCLIPDPNDAEQFLFDLLTEEIGSLISHGSTGDVVSVQHCIERLEKSAEFTDKEKERLQKALTEYSITKIEGFKKLFSRDEDKKDLKDTEDRVVAEEVLKLVYRADPEIMKTARQELSVLSTLDSCFTSGLNSIKLPRLRLGTILKEISDSSYLLCIQPLCDSIRIKNYRDTIFPFLSLKVANDQDNKCSLDICVPQKDGSAVWLSVYPKPNALVSYLFRAKSADEAFVEAVNSEGSLIFKTADGGKIFQWMADLKISKAQRIASQLAARIHTSGIDEFEWMRLHQAR